MRWLRRVRGAVLTGLTWALVWAPVAVLIGLVVDPDGSMDEMWPAIGAIPGFLGGVTFAAVLGIAARRRRLRELSLPAVAAWGALAGLLVGALPFVIGDPTSERPLWLLATVVVGSITLLSAASAAGSLALARRADTSASVDDGAAPDDVALRQSTESSTADERARLLSDPSGRLSAARPVAHAAVDAPHFVEREP